MAEIIGKMIGSRYKIVYSLGSGGFGHVYLAQDQISSDGCWCAIKQLRPSIFSGMGLEEARERFSIEAEVLRKIGEHDRIPKLLNYIEEDQQFYLVLEFIDGYKLEEEIESNRLTENQILILLKDVLETLNFIQQNDVIHRDISPDNLIRRIRDKQLVFIDFGAVKQTFLEIS